MVKAKKTTDIPCSKCGVPKPPDEFSPKTDAKTGRNSWCRKCHSTYKAEKRIADRAAAVEPWQQCEYHASRINNEVRWEGGFANLTAHGLYSLWKAWNGKCCGCGGDDAKWHMIHPMEKLPPGLLTGDYPCGSAVLDNMQLLCASCRSRKGSFIIDFRVKPPRILSNPWGAVTARKRGGE